MDSETLKARLAVDKIVRDLSDRRGLRQEWEQIDEDIQQKIRDVWTDIIRTEMSIQWTDCGKANFDVKS